MYMRGATVVGDTAGEQGGSDGLNGFEDHKGGWKGCKASKGGLEFLGEEAEIAPSRVGGSGGPVAGGASEQFGGETMLVARVRLLCTWGGG